MKIFISFILLGASLEIFADKFKYVGIDFGNRSQSISTKIEFLALDFLKRYHNYLTGLNNIGIKNGKFDDALSIQKEIKETISSAKKKDLLFLLNKEFPSFGNSQQGTRQTNNPSSFNSYTDKKRVIDAIIEILMREAKVLQSSLSDSVKLTKLTAVTSDLKLLSDISKEMSFNIPKLKGMDELRKEATIRRDSLLANVRSHIQAEKIALQLKKGLVGWWKFDEGSGKIAKDSSVMNRHGELNDFDSLTSHWVSGKIGNSLLFDGKKSYVDIGDFEWGGECSFSGWVKYNSFGNWARVFDFGNGRLKNNMLVANFEKSEGFELHNFLGRNNQKLQIENFWTLKKWVHVVCVVNTSSIASVFKNGNLIKAQKKKATPITMRKSQFIGKSNWPDNAYFHGQIDDFRIYDRALSAAEVQALYNLGQ